MMTLYTRRIYFHFYIIFIMSGAKTTENDPVPRLVYLFRSLHTQQELGLHSLSTGTVSELGFLSRTSGMTSCHSDNSCVRMHVIA